MSGFCRLLLYCPSLIILSAIGSIPIASGLLTTDKPTYSFYYLPQYHTKNDD